MKSVSVLGVIVVLVCATPGAGARTEGNGRGSRSFDGSAAYGFLKAQVRFGPRAPGTSGHRRCLQYFLDEFKSFGASLAPQEFTHTLPDGKSVTLTNVLASYNPGSKKRILISAHWDTRLWADKDPDRGNWNKPIPGANDGASGAAVILELARELQRFPPTIGVDFVLFDGEDLGKSGVPESFSVGAQYFAAHTPSGFSPQFGINIDMIGDRNLRIFREQNSEHLAPRVQELIFSTALKLNIPQFIDSVGEEITDDHMPLNEAGLQTVDLIDFQYPDESNRYWHTMSDTADKCSGESLAAVGRVLMEIIYSE